LCELFLLDYYSILAFTNCAEVAFLRSGTKELQNGGLPKSYTYKLEIVKKSEIKAKTKTKAENTTFIVNPLLFFMKNSFKSFALDSTLQLVLHYYNE